MLGLPKSTELSKQLPKKLIYEKFNMSNAEKERIDADISRITIVNEVSPTRVNIVAGETVKSFFVVLVQLKNKSFNEKNIIKITKLIPQNILFILECEDEEKLAVFRAGQLLQSEWSAKESHTIQLKGLNFDSVWENVIIQVGSVELEKDNTLDEQIAVDENRVKIEKEIARLEKQARAEKQPRKKYELVQKIRKLQNELT
jgi:hypothetical protein